MNRRRFLSRAAAGAAVLPIAGAHAAQNFGVPYQVLSSVIAGAFATRIASASVYVPSTNALITNAFLPDGSPAEPSLLVQGDSVYSHILAWLTAHSPPTEPQVLFEAVNPTNSTASYSATIYPGTSLGGAPATTIDTSGNVNSITGMMYVVVQSLGYHAGMALLSSWVFGLEVWPIGIPMLIDIAVNSTMNSSYGLSAHQYVQNQTSGYPINKTVKFGFSNAARPTMPINQNVQQNAVPWGTFGSNQLALQVGGSLLVPNSGLDQMSLHGFGLQTNYQTNPIITAARLVGRSGQFLVPNISSGPRLFDTFNVGGGPAPVALFGGADPSTDFFFGSNGQGISDFNTEPGGDSLVEDPTVVFQDQ